MSTIKDIAKDTGLSTATISKYLSGKPIKAHNKEIIRTSIEKLGYIPNTAAQSLRSRRTNAVCIFMPSLNDYFWGALCNELEDQLRKNNYFSIIRFYAEDSANFYDEQHFLQSRQVDGVIFIPSTYVTANFASLIKKADIPFVYIDQLYAITPSDGVTSANARTAEQAVDYLIARGHRRIGVIGGDRNSYTVTERYNGCRNSFRSHGLPEEDLLYLAGYFSMHSGNELSNTLLSMPNPPTAILSLGSNLTLGVLMSLPGKGLSIPRDFSFISFDDDQIFPAFDPPITVFHQDFPAIASQAVQILLRRIHGDYTDFPLSVQIPTQFIERNSVRDIR
jgi:DNA-binding LacI/PurR family transcriptional regulator